MLWQQTRPLQSAEGTTALPGCRYPGVHITCMTINYTYFTLTTIETALLNTLTKLKLRKRATITAAS